MIWNGSIDHVEGIWRNEFNLFDVNHVLNLVFQHPTIVSIMPRTAGMISTYCIRIVVRRRSFRVWMKSYQSNQIHPQHVLQCLRQWHVDVGKLSFGLVLPSLISPLLLSMRYRTEDQDCPHMLVVVTLVMTLLAIHNIGLFLPIVWIFMSIRGCSSLDISTSDSIFNSLPS